MDDIVQALLALAVILSFCAWLGPRLPVDLEDWDDWRD